jgi:hypothetical protein
MPISWRFKPLNDRAAETSQQTIEYRKESPPASSWMCLNNPIRIGTQASGSLLLERLRESAKGTGQKDQGINIRLSSHDLQAIRTQALLAGIPYQTLISSILYQSVSRSRLHPLE